MPKAAGGQPYQKARKATGTRAVPVDPVLADIPIYPIIGYTRTVIRSFADASTEDLYAGRNTKAARRRLPRELWGRARRLLDQLQAAHTVGDMAQPPGNHLEPFGEGFSVRVNDQYRVTFRWKDGAAEEVWCGDYHDD